VVSDHAGAIHQATAPLERAPVAQVCK